MTVYADLELGLHRYEAGAYAVDMRFTQPGDDADTRLDQGEPVNVSLDPAALNTLALDQYGPALTAALFAPADLKTAFIQAMTASQAMGAVLRLRLLIGCQVSGPQQGVNDSARPETATVMRPASSIRKVVRFTPKYFRPNMDFSPQTPYFAATA